MRLIFSLLIALSSFCSSAQYFEGVVTYQTQMLNPNPAAIPDSLWDAMIEEKIGPNGVMKQSYYYQGQQYMSEMTMGSTFGYQLYNPKDGLLYSWEMDSDTAITYDSRKSMDPFTGFEPVEGEQVVYGITCKGIKLKSLLGSMTLWYNPEYLKIDPKLFKGHKYGHFEAMIKELGCLPLKSEQKNGMVSMVQTVVSIKEGPVDKAKFKLPKFKTVIANPIN